MAIHTEIHSGVRISIHPDYYAEDPAEWGWEPCSELESLRAQWKNGEVFCVLAEALDGEFLYSLSGLYPDGSSEPYAHGITELLNWIDIKEETENLIARLRG